MATNIYIDGFNLYYGCVKGTPYRWLNLEAFCRQLLPSEDIHRIRYFTARVSGKADPMAPLRQGVFLRALNTLPLVSIHYGHFLTTQAWMRLWHPPATGPKRVCVVKREEKGSDVNLATNLLLVLRPHSFASLTPFGRVDRAAAGERSSRRLRPVFPWCPQP